MLSLLLLTYILFRYKEYEGFSLHEPCDILVFADFAQPCKISKQVLYVLIL